MSTVSSARSGRTFGPSGRNLDVERDSDVPISTQIYWQLAYQIDSGRLLGGARLPPAREPGAATAGFAGEGGAAAAFASATERKRPGRLVRVLFAECTSADAGYDAERLNDAFPGLIEAEGTLLDELPDRLGRVPHDPRATRA